MRREVVAGGRPAGSYEDSRGYVAAHELKKKYQGLSRELRAAQKRLRELKSDATEAQRKLAADAVERIQRGLEECEQQALALK